MPSSLAIFGGFAAFFIMEKSLRVLGGEDESGHSHSHSHTHSPSTNDASHASGVSVASTSEGLRTRAGGSEKSSGVIDTPDVAEDMISTTSSSSKLSAYLNLFGDFVHNMQVFFVASALCRHIAPRSANNFHLLTVRTALRT